jgi:hypothetical protein
LVTSGINGDSIFCAEAAIRITSSIHSVNRRNDPLATVQPAGGRLLCDLGSLWSIDLRVPRLADPSSTLRCVSFAHLD